MRGWLDLHEGEGPRVAAAFSFFFALLCSWYVLRAVRDEMGVLGGTDRLRWLFLATFGATLVAAPAFAWLASRHPRRRIAPLTYHVVAALLVAFWAGATFAGPGAAAVVARVAFVALSVYSLFVVSVFWSLMADAFTDGQARRLYGVIAAGGTCGALAGPLVAAFLATRLGTLPLFLVAAVLLEACVVLSLVVTRGTVARPDAREDRPLGGSLLEGLARTASDPFLRRIALQTIVATTLATFLYLQQARIVEAASDDSGTRTALFASIDLATNVLTLLLQAVVTGPVLERLGVGVGLAVVPAACLAGFGVLAVAPAFAAILAVQAGRRALHHAIERPAREVLFTSVAPIDKYKSKNVLDTVVYRGGDAASAWLHDGLRALGSAVPALAALPIAAGGIVLARDLATRHRAHASRSGEDVP